MDTQECSLVFESYSYNNQEVAINWADNSSGLVALTVAGAELPDFNLIASGTDKTVELYTAGTWDQLVVRFVFNRQMGFYIIQAYMPTLTCVMMVRIPVPFPLDAGSVQLEVPVLAVILSGHNGGPGQVRVPCLFVRRDSEGLQTWLG